MGHTDAVEAVAFSPDGLVMISGSGAQDGTIRLWDPFTTQQHASIASYSVRTVAFSPDGRTFASGSGDGTILIWDRATVEGTDPFTRARAF